MFTNIPEIWVTVALTAVAVLAWLAIVQYSEYIAHIKKNPTDEASREFAFIPYLVVPAIFGAIAVVGALFCADYLAVHGWITGAEEVCGLSIGLGVLIYAVLDRYIVSQAGDATYFRTIEDKVVDAVKSASNYSDEDIAFLEAVKRMKSQK